MKWNSIRTKLIVFMLIASVVPIVATMFVTYYYTTSSLKARVAHEDANLLYQGQRNIAGLLEDLNRSSSTVYSNTELFRLLEAGYEDVQSNSRVYAAMSYISTSIPDIYQVYLYESVNHKATLVTLNTPKRNYNTALFKDALDKNDRSLFVQSTHMSHSYGFAKLQPKYPSEPVFTLHRRIERVPSSEVIGYLSIDVKYSAISDIVEQLYKKDQEKMYIIDNEGFIVYSDAEEKLGQSVQAAWYRNHIFNTADNKGSFEEDNNVFVYQRLQAVGADWTLVKQVPVSYLNREANQAVGINLLLLAFSLIIIVIATILISIRITSPIKQLGKYMNEIQIGNLNVDIKPSSNDEIGAVIVRFRGMMDTINNLILQEYKLELSNKTNQLRALQAQINPHFLNNTLQIIGTLALELNVPRIYALLSALAKMMHYSMNNEDKIVTLRDELEHVKAYIELQKERFENRFDFRYDVEESLLDTPMPKMILQPIIENYFKHGINRSKTDGLITIHANVWKNEQVEVTIQNNGVMIPENKLEHLQTELNNFTNPGVTRPGDAEKDAGRLTIGLTNVLARLQLVCGENASLTITNLEPVGVMITLIFANISSKAGHEEE
ncbi:Sensor histidine kinase YpdA [compost metagenome]